MTYSPNSGTHNALSDRASLWCSVDGMYCTPVEPCDCCEPLDLATGGIVKGSSSPDDDSVPAMLDSGYVIPGSATEAEYVEEHPEVAEAGLAPSQPATPQAEVKMVVDGDTGVSGEASG